MKRKRISTLRKAALVRLLNAATKGGMSLNEVAHCLGISATNLCRWRRDVAK
ncbi:hypothetical protein [Geminisphaera colitermitum]|uniref:hypothetical protein n=1 Tax=Geminisphaera colitermitum TaxID=1148786 RepID=UPI0001964F53|nr:hypothetical protein [Geminisphaera colitermitum]